LVSTIPEASALFKRYFQILMSAFKEQKEKLETFLESEEEMSIVRHENYLKTVSILEVIGHLILNPYKLRLSTRQCPDCDPYFIEINNSIASPWAASVLRRIDLPDNDGKIGFKFGRYDENTREFV